MENMLFSHINRLLSEKESVTLAIEGSCASGKSTLAERLRQVYDCNVFRMDDFFLTPELKTEQRLEEIGGNIDYERFRREVIIGIKSGEPFQYQVYDCKRGCISQTVLVLPKKLNIIEGVYSMHPTLSQEYDLKIFMVISPEEQQNRIAQRNGAKMLRTFLEEWIPLENRYFAELRIQEKCDLIFQR